jgi:hypothetical protein
MGIHNLYMFLINPSASFKNAFDQDFFVARVDSAFWVKLFEKKCQKTTFVI